VFPDGYVCKACGTKGDVFTWLQFSEGLGFLAALRQLESFPLSAAYRPPRFQHTARPITRGLDLDYHLNLDEHALRYYQQRGLEKETIVKFRLGYGPPPGHKDHWFTIPVYQEEKLVNIKFRRDDACPRCKSFHTTEDHLTLTCLECGKVWAASDPAKYRGISGAVPSLFNSKYLYRGAAYPAVQYPGQCGTIDQVIITEGEFDVMAAKQAGYRATCSTGGAGSFREAWVPLFRQVRHLYAIYDNDAAGTAGLKGLSSLLPRVRPVRLPVGSKGDLNDFLLARRRSDLDALLMRARIRERQRLEFAVLKQTEGATAVA
jgi:DNA primase